MAIFLIIILGLLISGALPYWINAGEKTDKTPAPARPYTYEALQSTIAENNAIWAGRP